MSTAIAPVAPSMTAIEQVLIKGDLSSLSETQRLSHYKNVCESLGLNPLTTPFDYLKLNGKTVLYAKRDAAEQLRKIHGVSIVELKTERFDEVYVVTAKAQDKTGRTDASTGAVPIGRLVGEALANALMKAETKAKRRVTLSLCGLGMLDETEVDSIPSARPEGYTVTAPASEPAIVEASTSDDHGYRILRVEAKPTKNPNVTKYTLVMSTGESFNTINPRLAALAEQLCQSGESVAITSRQSKYGSDVVTLDRVTGENARLDAEIVYGEAF